MGVAIYVVLNSATPGFDAMVDGKAIGHLDDELMERIAVERGVLTFAELSSINPAELPDLDFPEGAPALPPEAWFEPDEGLRSVAAFREYFLRNPVPERVRTAQSTNQSTRDADTADRARQRTDAVLSDLDGFEAVLTQAKARGLKFHFAVDF
jgi:hypothetical protein